MKLDNNKILVIIFGIIIIISLISQFLVSKFSNKINTVIKFDSENSKSTINVESESKNLDLINKIYGLDSFIGVNNNLHGNKYNLTYGEMTYDGMKNIIEYCKNKNIPHNTFIDLGCGSGRTLAYAINCGFEKAKGVEIVEKRYNYAVNAINKLSPEIKQKITLDNKDLFDLISGYIPKDSVIFVSNLLFPKETDEQLIKYLSYIAPANVYIIISKLPDNLYDFKLIEQIDVPMSWNKHSKCYVLSR